MPSCSVCGHENAESAKFCSECGGSLELSSQAALLAAEIGDDEIRADALVIAQRLADGPWRDATMATVDRRYTDAADILASIGEEPLQAQARRLAARELAREGRMADATAQLDQARAFWLSVGATAYLREADDVLAAAG